MNARDAWWAHLHGGCEPCNAATRSGDPAECCPRGLAKLDAHIAEWFEVAAPQAKAASKAAK